LLLVRELDYLSFAFGDYEANDQLNFIFHFGFQILGGGGEGSMTQNLLYRFWDLRV